MIATTSSIAASTPTTIAATHGSSSVNMFDSHSLSKSLHTKQTSSIALTNGKRHQIFTLELMNRVLEAIHCQSISIKHHYVYYILLVKSIDHHVRDF